MKLDMHCFTPNDDWFLKTDVPHGIVNVCEDARIEKLMKRKYMGLAKTFYYGYSELHDDDFFNLEDEDIDKFNLADRINLYYKIGNFLDLQFTERETEIRELVGKSETFDEVLEALKFFMSIARKSKRIKRKLQILIIFNYLWVDYLISLILRKLVSKVKKKNGEVIPGSSSPKAEEAEGSDKDGDMTEQPTADQSDKGGEKE